MAEVENWMRGTWLASFPKPRAYITPSSAFQFRVNLMGFKAPERPAIPLHIIDLPSEEELTVPEIPLTSSALKASGHHLGRQCDRENKEFMLCKKEEQDPRLCVKEGRKVTQCAFDFYMKIKGDCNDSFTQYWTCLDYRGQKLNKCRKQQAEFDKCVLEKLGWVRPEVGELSKVTVLDAERPLSDQPYDEPPVRHTTKTPDKLPKAKEQDGQFFFNT